MDLSSPVFLSAAIKVPLIIYPDRILSWGNRCKIRNSERLYTACYSPNIIIAAEIPKYPEIAPKKMKKNLTIRILKENE